MKKTIEKHMLIDGKNLAYQAHYGAPHLTTSKGFLSGALYGYLQTLRRLILAENPSMVVVCWDGRKSLYRNAIYPDYKGNRVHARDIDFLNQLTAMSDTGRILGIAQIKHLELEADDLIAAYVDAMLRVYPEKDCHTVIVSTDKDFWQLVASPAVSIINPRTDVVTNYKNFKSVTGFHSAEDYLEYKIIVGDPGDNIPGLLYGIGDKKARGMIDEGLHANDLVPKGVTPQRILLQRKLIDLSHSVEALRKSTTCLVGILGGTGVHESKFRNMCRHWEFKSMLGNWEEWRTPFKTLYERRKVRLCFRARQRALFKNALLKVNGNEKAKKSC